MFEFFYSLLVCMADTGSFGVAPTKKKIQKR